MAISAAEVKKLRDMTGAGVMDCKRALEESGGDLEQAISVIRKKGQLIASKRVDREAMEGCVIAKISGDAAKGVITVLKCETDFVAKNQDFVKFTEDIAEAALLNNPQKVEELSELTVNSISIAEGVNEKVAIIGEKIELSYFDSVEAAEVVAYIHPGNKLACLVGFNKSLTDKQTGRDIAMQIAAMNPVAIDKESLTDDIIAKETEIAIEQTKLDPKNEGKSDDMIAKIAQGRLEKFYKEMLLLNQEYIKDNKMKVADFLKAADKELKITKFVRFSLTA